MNKIWSDEQAKGNSVPWLLHQLSTKPRYLQQEDKSHIWAIKFSTTKQSTEAEKSQFPLSTWALEIRATFST